MNPIDDAVIVDACTLKNFSVVALTEAAKAHEAIEGRGTVAKTLLLTG